MGMNQEIHPCIFTGFRLYLDYLPMKTIKLRVSNGVDVLGDMQLYSSVVRVAFNRFVDGMEEKEVRAYCRARFEHNSWLIQCAISEAKTIHKNSNGKPIIFGGRHNLCQYMRGVIDKATFKYRRMMPIRIMGECLQKGNRLFNFLFDAHTVVYKPSRTRHVAIKFFPMKKAISEELRKVQAAAAQQKLGITVTLSDKYICITYDDTLVNRLQYTGLKQTRILGIDTNPDYVGISVLAFDDKNEFKVLHKRVYDLTALNKNTGSRKSPNANRYKANKRRHETIAIAHEIADLVNVWKCKTVAIEDIKLRSTDFGKGTHVNRKCNNEWLRSMFARKLRMLGGMHGFDVVAINPAYSSIVGNFAYGGENTPDMVAASMEIARRAYRKFERGWFYPKFNIRLRDEQWKQTLVAVDDWRVLFSKIKETGLKYRFLLKDYIQNAVFSKTYKQRCYSVYTFA